MSKTIREQRFEKVIEIISCNNIRNVAEFGCGNGKFIPYLKKLNNIKEIAVIDKDEKNIKRLKSKYTDVKSYCASFLSLYNQFIGFDCVVAIEVIEHLSNHELAQLKRVVFEIISPKLIIFTTPNIEYNVNYPILFDGFRHATHLFEFSPTELCNWGKDIVVQYKNYNFYTDFCDVNTSSQIIVFYKEN